MRKALRRSQGVTVLRLMPLVGVEVPAAARRRRKKLKEVKKREQMMLRPPAVERMAERETGSLRESWIVMSSSRGRRRLGSAAR